MQLVVEHVLSMHEALGSTPSITTDIKIKISVHLKSKEIAYYLCHTFKFLGFPVMFCVLPRVC